MLRMYDELATWWHLVSTPADYVEEAEHFLELFADVTSRGPATLLELGSGGGNNALHVKAGFSAVTLVDLSPKMLAASQQINPDCEHIQGDMRSVRLGRTFDAVMIHDAIDYMLTLDDLRQAMETAYIHCKPGGLALFVPDHVRETYEPSTDHGGSDGDGRGVRYLEWSQDADEADSTYTTDYVFVLRETGQPVRIVHDHHVLGLFPRDEWLRTIREVGFEPDFVIDSFDRHVFVADKP